MRNLCIWSTMMGLFMCSLLPSCKEDDDNGSKIELTKHSYTMKYKEKVAFEGKTDLKIEDTFIASFEDGNICGNHIGTVDGIYKGKDKISIEVKPLYEYVDYPITDWGSSLSTIKSKQPSKWKLQSTSNSNSLTYFLYSGTAVKYITIYMFENGKLKSSGLLSPVSEMTTLTNWLSQKYLLAPTSNSDIVVAGCDANDPSDAKTIVGISSETLSNTSYSLYSKYVYMTVFTPSSSTKGANSDYYVPENAQLIEALSSTGIQVSKE